MNHATILGNALGLHPDFLARVESLGQKAIIDRVQYVDATGAHGRLLSMVQQYGRFLDDSVMRQKPVEATQQAAVVAKIAEFHKVNPELALNLIGAIQEVFQMSLERMGQEGTENNGYKNSPTTANNASGPAGNTATAGASARPNPQL